MAFKTLFDSQFSHIIKMEEYSKHLQFLEMNWKSIRTLKPCKKASLNEQLKEIEKTVE